MNVRARNHIRFGGAAMILVKPVDEIRSMARIVGGYVFVFVENDKHFVHCALGLNNELDAPVCAKSFAHCVVASL